jgi:YVTN family beta-propeller protein
MILLAALFAQSLLPAQSTPSETLLVLSKADNSLAIVDPASLKVLARIPVGQDPHEVIASSDGKLAYVSNYGGGTGSTIAVVDLVNQKALPPIDLGPLRGAHGLVFVAGKLWFTAEGAKVVASYDPSAQKIDWVLGTGQNRTHMIFVSSDLKRIVTANVSSGTMSIIEKTTVAGRGGPPPGGPKGPPGGGRGGPKGPPPGGPRSDWDQTVITVGNGPEGFDVSPDGKEIWAANAQDGTVSIIEVAGKKVSATLDANVRGANRLKFTLDGKRVLVSTLGGMDLTVIDASTHLPIKRVPIGHGAAGQLMHPDGSRAFVACTPDNYVAIIDLKSLQVTGHIEAGGQPDGLAWAVRRD